MTSPSDPVREGRNLRDRAQRIRRMAAGLSLAADRDRLTLYADALERQAAELERDALSPASSAQPVAHQQQQVQQQQETNSAPRPAKPRS